MLQFGKDLNTNMGSLDAQDYVSNPLAHSQHFSHIIYRGDFSHSPLYISRQNIIDIIRFETALTAEINNLIEKVKSEGRFKDYISYPNNWEEAILTAETLRNLVRGCYRNRNSEALDRNGKPTAIFKNLVEHYFKQYVRGYLPQL